MRARKFSLKAGCLSLRSSLWGVFALFGLLALICLAGPVAAQDTAGSAPDKVAVSPQTQGSPKGPEKSACTDDASVVKQSAKKSDAAMARRKRNGDPPSRIQLNAQLRAANSANQRINRTMRGLNTTLRDMRSTMSRIQTLNRLPR